LFPQTLNPYSYAGNNPETLNDPTGLNACNHDPQECGGEGTPGVAPASGQAPAGSCYGDCGGGAPYNPMGNSDSSGGGGVSPGSTMGTARASGPHDPGAVGYGYFPWMPGAWYPALPGDTWQSLLYNVFAKDFVGCARGSAGSCAMAVLTAAPVGKVFKVGELAVDGVRAARAADAAARAADAGASTARDAAQSCLNSFTADTPVTMADGREESIADVKLGDKVLATDPETGITEAKPVVALIRHSGKHRMVDLSLSDGSMITTTDHHPFWDASTRTFSDAIDLRIGDQVLSDNGETLTISGAHVYERDLTAYNLQIDGIHTYYAGATPVLVHNSCGLPADGSSMSVDQALTRGQHWLGEGYTEPVAGSGRYVSSDGTRVFRMGDSDITGAHGGGPHVNFEELVPNPARPGRLMVGSNSHVYLLDP
jgi:hypothetical protein